ncbi:MAG: 4-hydroxy-tetrahydrodipicolinate synthase [Saprospiraceae bacterium]|nr:4-hydroxy-tetrahydrodipicolinate synthase [Saprospiraceae bacterium]
MTKNLIGTGVALVTPFDVDLSIDYIGLGRLLEHVINGGADYLVVCGTTGESVTLSISEKSELLKHVIDLNQNRLPIVYGIGGNNTQECIETIENTEFNGVKAILSVSPYYNKPSQDGIIKHYNTIADSSPVPVILYNVPGRTSSNLSWQTTVTLSQHSNIIGIKEASGDLVQSMRIKSKVSDDFLLISGDDLLTGPLMSVGAVGVISVLANAFPEVFRSMMDARQNNDYLKINGSISKLLEINSFMFTEGNPVGIKEVLHQMNICSNHVRLPLISASEGLKKAISSELGNI